MTEFKRTPGVIKREMEEFWAARHAEERARENPLTGEKARETAALIAYNVNRTRGY